MKLDTKQTIRLLIDEAFNRGNLLLLQDIVHPEYRYTSPTDSMEGIEDLKAFIMAIRSAFPDLYIKVADQVAEGEKVCTRISMTGTHQGDFLGIPATGQSVKLEGVVISQLRDRLIWREWELLDQLTLLQQLGLASKNA